MTVRTVGELLPVMLREPNKEAEAMKCLSKQPSKSVLSEILMLVLQSSGAEGLYHFNFQPRLNSLPKSQGTVKIVT